MSWEVRWTTASLGDLKKIDREAARNLIDVHINKVKTNPYSGKPLKKGLKLFNSYNLKFKNVEYRIAYKIFPEKKVVLVYMVGSRENFYRKLQRRIR
ncbi:MAG: type II toxin-antitoxin system RelE/ParE family toxin [Candidatus Eremiobacteraeota bacterium]|nr:type II toxin-antitoxin system RelE/ParE family toxin [Candidatus Eremiobacteraeota bacterium]